MLPLKWYPLELILSTNKRYDEKSDIWSFGLTCWEVISYGAMPYQNTDITNLVYLLENEHRLEKPVDCPQELYDIMCKCWLSNRLERPVFSELVLDLERICLRDDDATLKDFSPLEEIEAQIRTDRDKTQWRDYDEDFIDEKPNETLKRNTSNKGDFISNMIPVGTLGATNHMHNRINSLEK